VELKPLGSLMSLSRGNARRLNFAKVGYESTFFVEAGETISAVAVPDEPGMTLWIELPGLVGPITAAGPGQPVVLPTTRIPATGEYAVRVFGDVPGTYYLDIGKNLVRETSDSSPLSPLRIDASFVSLGSGRFGVLGVSQTPADVDQFALDLTGRAGQPVDIALAGQSGVSFSASLLEVLAPDGATVLATATPSPLGVKATNYDLAVLGFPVPADGVYYLRLTASVAGEYAVLVADSLVFDTEPNNQYDMLRSLDAAGTALGYLDGASGSDWYTLTLTAGDRRSLSTQTPFDEWDETPLSFVDPKLVVIGPNGQTIASNLDGAGDNKNAWLAFAAPQSGVYKVQVAAEYGRGAYLLEVREAAAVAGRHVFYNNSAFDGHDAAANADDDQAIAGDKRALLPGQTASFANYTSYIRGINGIMIDVARLAGADRLTAADFAFRAGNSNDPSAWPVAPTPSGITVRRGAGVGGSDRITLLWSNGIMGQWLQTTLLATANTGLVQSDVFYFGNAPGEAGNSTTDAKVDAIDMLLARANPRTFLDPVPIDFAYDFNRDGRVNATDVLIARNNQTSTQTALKLIALGKRGGVGQDGRVGRAQRVPPAKYKAPALLHVFS
jgi:hypothetical protein